MVNKNYITTISHIRLNPTEPRRIASTLLTLHTLSQC